MSHPGHHDTLSVHQTNTHQRHLSDKSQGVGQKLSGLFGSDDTGLPMYKDKPYNYAPSKRRSSLVGKRAVFALVSIVLVLLYLSGLFSRGGSDNKQWKKPGGLKGLLSGTFGKDWPARQEKVREAFQISWSAYEKNAWGYDEFHPVSRNGRNMSPKGMGWIIVDALDTMMIMNLTTELTHAREWVSKLDYDQNQNVNTFETTIRMLGGLLSAHYISTTFPDMAPIAAMGGADSDDLYLEKASDLADRLTGAYESKSGIPYASINLQSRKGVLSHADGGASSTAEAGTTQLEMKYLSKLTGEAHFWQLAERAIEAIDANGVEDGLVPIFIHPDTGSFRGENIRLGSRGDSYYGERVHLHVHPDYERMIFGANSKLEYLIKQYLQTSKQEPIYLEMWEQALAGVQKHLITYSEKVNLTILAERPNGLHAKLLPKMDHLVCFMPGTIALAATGGLPLSEARKSPSWGTKQDEEMRLAEELMKTCWGMYKVTATGLAPEIAHFRIPEEPRMMQDRVLTSATELGEAQDSDWRADYEIHAADFHNLQRPETIESLFYMWRITGQEKYREWGWSMFKSFCEHTSLENGGGFDSIHNVDKIPTSFRDNMESFWLAETLKYFYLLFGPNDVFPLDKVVFNTEAHPFPRFELGKLFKTNWSRRPRDVTGKILS